MCAYVCVCVFVPAVTAHATDCNVTKTNSFYRLLAMLSWILIRELAKAYFSSYV